MNAKRSSKSCNTRWSLNIGACVLDESSAFTHQIILHLISEKYPVNDDDERYYGSHRATDEKGADRRIPYLILAWGSFYPI